MTSSYGPIEPRHREIMNEVARGLDKIFNGTKAGNDRDVGFVLLVFPFNNHDGRANYISNGADRKDMVVFFKELIARFEGQAEEQGSA